MRNFIIQMLNALSIIIIVLCTSVGGFIAIASSPNIFIGMLITLAIFIAVSVPMGVFLVLCSINDKLNNIKRGA